MRKTLSFLLVICMIMSILPAAFALSRACDYCGADNFIECPSCGWSDLCGECGHCYCGLENKTTTVQYGCDSSYTVIIPEDIIIPSYEEPGVGNVSIKDAMLYSHQTLQVYITGDTYQVNEDAWELNERTNGHKLYYVITSDAESLIPDSLVLAVEAGEAHNRTVTKELLFALTEKPVHAGHYTSQVTFFVEIEQPGPQLDTPYIYSSVWGSMVDSYAYVFKEDGTLLFFSTDAPVSERSINTREAAAAPVDQELYLERTSTWEYDPASHVIRDVDYDSYYLMNDAFTEMYPMSLPKSSGFDITDMQPNYNIVYAATGCEQTIPEGRRFETDGGFLTLTFQDQNTTAVFSYIDNGTIQTQQYENITWDKYGHIGIVDEHITIYVSLDAAQIYFVTEYGSEYFNMAIEETYDDGLIPGLYTPGAIEKYLNGEDVSDMLLLSWKQMISMGYITVEDGVAYALHDWDNEEIYLEEYDLWITSSWSHGDLFFPDNGTVEHIYEFDSMHLTGVYVPNAIQTVNTFACNPYLTIAYLDSNDTYLNYTFEGCLSLTTVKLPNTVEELYGTFYACVSLQHIDLPESVWYIGDGLFGYTQITEVDLSNITTLGAWLFADSNIEHIEITKNITHLENNVFTNSETTYSVEAGHPVFAYIDGCLVDIKQGTIIIGNPNGPIPTDNRIHSIGPGAYASIELSNPNLVIPSNITEIQEFAFGESNLVSVVIPGTVKTIQASAFESCRSLQSVEMEHGVETISEYAFWYCENLETCIIPSSVTFASSNAFTGTALTSLNMYGFNSVLTSNTLKLSTLESLLIPDGIQVIQKNAFTQCTSLTTVTLGQTIRQIVSGAFPETVTTIIYQGTKAQAQEHIDAARWNLSDSITTIQCSDGLLCTEHTGGTATCVAKAVCEICNTGYGALSYVHDIQGTSCVLCGQEGVKFETSHNPYQSAKEGTLLGTFNFEGAKGVRITTVYKTTDYATDYAAIAQGTNWSSINEKYLYMYSQSIAGATGSSTWAYIKDFLNGHFGGYSADGMIVRSQYMQGWTSGSVIWVADEINNNDYGFTVIVTPVY